MLVLRHVKYVFLEGVLRGPPGESEEKEEGKGRRRRREKEAREGSGASISFTSEAQPHD